MYYVLSFNMRSLSGNRYVNIMLAGLVDFVGQILVIPANNK